MQSFQTAEYVTSKIICECRLASASSKVSFWIEPACVDFVSSEASVSLVARVEHSTNATAATATSREDDAAVISSAVAATTSYC